MTGIRQIASETAHDYVAQIALAGGRERDVWPEAAEAWWVFQRGGYSSSNASTERADLALDADIPEPPPGRKKRSSMPRFVVRDAFQRRLFAHALLPSPVLIGQDDRGTRSATTRRDGKRSGAGLASIMSTLPKTSVVGGVSEFDDDRAVDRLVTTTWSGVR
jgi:hypothetical protein